MTITLLVLQGMLLPITMRYILPVWSRTLPLQWHPHITLLHSIITQHQTHHIVSNHTYSPPHTLHLETEWQILEQSTRESAPFCPWYDPVLHVWCWKERRTFLSLQGEQRYVSCARSCAHIQHTTYTTPHCAAYKFNTTRYTTHISYIQTTEKCSNIPFSINTALLNDTAGIFYGVNGINGDGMLVSLFVCLFVSHFRFFSQSTLPIFFVAGTVPLISLGYMCVKGWKDVSCDTSDPYSPHFCTLVPSHNIFFYFSESI